MSLPPLSVSEQKLVDSALVDFKLPDATPASQFTFLYQVYEWSLRFTSELVDAASRDRVIEGIITAIFAKAGLALSGPDLILVAEFLPQITGLVVKVEQGLLRGLAIAEQEIASGCCWCGRVKSKPS